MKALKVIGLLLGSLLCGWASYLVYPTAYHQTWKSFLAFVTNESTRQWSGLILILTALVLVGMAVWTIWPPPPKPYRSPNVD